MSVRVMNSVFWAENLSSTETLVLLAIGDTANDNGFGYLLIDTLMRKTKLSRRTIQATIAALCQGDRPLLERRERHNRSSIFRVHVERIPQMDRTTSDKEKSIEELWGAGDAPQEFGAREMRVGAREMRVGAREMRVGAREMRVGGANDDAQRAGDAPRTICIPSKVPNLNGAESISPDLDLLGDPIRSPEQIKAAEESALVDFVASRWKKLVADNDGRITDIRTISDARRAAIIARGDRSAWEEVFEQIDASRWLRGLEKPGRGYSAPMTIRLDWLLTPANWDQTIEGNHRDKRALSTDFDAASGRRLTAVEQASRNVADRLRASREQRGGGFYRRGDDAGAPQLVDGRARRD